MKPEYSPVEVEAQAQSYWAENLCFKAVEKPGADKFYCLSMFPYPSGKLHMGHVRNYTIGDVISRYQRMKGKNVLQPIGFDAFGLPAENAAIKNNVPPAAWTYSNIDTMCGQLKQLGIGYDWDRKLATCEPEYYRWQQWFFTELLKRGLIYRRNSRVNWDPVDQTVLANEQVIDGRGWRSGAVVEQREIPQWFLKITAYADELLDEVKQLEHWPEAVRTMQSNWIGRSEGLEIDFTVADRSEKLTVFTTRPDTLYGVTFVSVAAQHPLALEAAARDATVAAFVEEASRGDVTEAAMETMEKRGVALGIDVIHPLTGDHVPVYAANFVLMSYGSGAVMAVPGHDQRDWEFATKYGLPIKAVIAAAAEGPAPELSEGAFTEKAFTINSAEFSGLAFKDAFDGIAARLKAQNAGRRRVNYRLRDWGVSRQRYWGCPIPIIYCEDCDAVPVPADQLPVQLPEDLVPDGRGNPLLRLPEFVNVACPQCGKPARRETDTFDTFVDSSWYYARFASAGCETGMVDERAAYWLPVDQYIGGIEHAILHLLYARFFSKLMRDCGLPAVAEPFKRLLTQGMVLAEGYYRTTESGGREWIAPKDVEVERDAKGSAIGAKLKSTGEAVVASGLGTMSKSKNNGVDPAAIIESHGADAVRLFMMFTAPPEQTLEWSDAGIDGAARFLKRVWKLVSDHVALGAVEALDRVALNDTQKDLRRKLHDQLAKISDDFGRRYNFNTAVAACMELVNALAKFDDRSPQGRAVLDEALDALSRVLSPIVPHFSHALWTALGHATPVIDAEWPEPEAEARLSDQIKLVVQVNGKLRGQISVPAGSSQDAIIAVALADEQVQRFLVGATIRKQVVVPGKLVNFVI
ncbi:leucine--tRNA ligase [Nevskia ramosa]|uniref:leucine--tRNA ligase n=1 Tax=Nevskia ramosa TaxID=64002 RepID=UPI002355050D|nr:leucine--tRNA ligase [Nevskia ramosa]